MTSVTASVYSVMFIAFLKGHQEYWFITWWIIFCSTSIRRILKCCSVEVSVVVQRRLTAKRSIQ